MLRMRNQTAVITGAASGIGRATAWRLAEEGARVLLLDKDGSRLQPLVDAIGAQATGLVADVLVPEGQEAVTRVIQEQGGTADVLVNCVGGSTGLEKADLPLTSMSEEQWRQMLHFNLVGTFLCCRTLIPYLERSSTAAIVNLSSISGRWNTLQSGVAYATAKAGLIGFTRRLSAELAARGIRCNAVAPGYVMTDRIRENVWGRASEEQRARMLDAIPLHRLADPGEIAAAIAFLASSDASYITGVTLDCNGGVHAG